MIYQKYKYHFKNIAFYLCAVLFLIAAFSAGGIKASENELVSLAQKHLDNLEYYNSITESMRYQFLYPAGKYYSLSLLIMGEAYYRGGNYNAASETMLSCYDKFKNHRDGERALVELGHMRLIAGSPFFSYRSYLEYQYIYPKGTYSEQASIGKCYALASQLELDESTKAIEEYYRAYPDGLYYSNAKELQNLITTEINRPKKSVAISVAGSILIPGFGNFYTGRYATGFFSFLSNALLLYLIYDGYRDDNKFRMIFFSVMEFSFYQYSLYSSVRNVYEYNSRKEFQKDMKISAQKTFHF